MLEVSITKIGYDLIPYEKRYTATTEKIQSVYNFFELKYAQIDIIAGVLQYIVERGENTYYIYFTDGEEDYTYNEMVQLCILNNEIEKLRQYAHSRNWADD